MLTQKATLTGKGQQPVRVLCITDQPEFKRWVEHHLETFLSSVMCVHYSPSVQSWLHEGFVASGYDLVLLDGAANHGTALQGLADLANRKAFAPIVYFALTKDELDQALALGAKAGFSRVRFNHREFAADLRELIEQRRRLKASLSLQQASQDSSMHKSLPLPILPVHLAWLQPLIDRLMAKDPKHRYQSADELIAAVSVLKSKAELINSMS